MNNNIQWRNFEIKYGWLCVEREEKTPTSMRGRQNNKQTIIEK